MNDDLFTLPSEAFHKRLLKAGNYEESKHPRDAKGRWSAGGAAAAGAAATGLGIAAALATRNPTMLRHGRQMRRAYTGYRSAGMNPADAALNTGIGHAARQAVDRGYRGARTMDWAANNMIARGVGGVTRARRAVFGR